MIALQASILNSLVIYPQHIDDFLEKVPLKLFTKEARHILKHILELRDKELLGLDILNTTLSDDFKKNEFYIEFISAFPNPNVLKLSEVMLKKYQITKQKDIALKLNLASDKNELLDIFTLSQEVEEVEIETKELKTLTQWCKEYENKPLLQKFPTGVSFLDSAFNGGIELAKLVLISGDPEAGKTMLGLQILENISKNNQKVCFFSFEFTIDDYLKRRDNTSKFLKPDNFYIINEGYDLDEVVRNIKTLYRRGVKVFLIDSQMRINSDIQALNVEEVESKKFSTLAKLCHSLEIVVFFIIQNSKSDRDNPMGSKKGGHEANIIIRIERVAPEKNDLLQKNNEFDENARLLIVKKNKQTGKHFKEKVFFDKKELRFYSYSNEATVHVFDMKEIEKESNEEEPF